MNQVVPASAATYTPATKRAGNNMGGAQLVDHYLAESYILVDEWDALPLQFQESMLLSSDRSGMLNQLVDCGLLTEYQAGRIAAGTTFGLVLGNYRILDRIGAGGMAVVFRAQHLDLRHTVAIKVLPSSPGQDVRLEHRFFAEMRTIARLRHPNIVAATDAGRLNNPDPNGTSFRYLVMEFIPGKDLEEYVLSSGPLPVGRACSLSYQIASALAETSKLGLVHRDIKPSNIMVTAEEQAKLLDFGLSMHLQHRMTAPGAVLGTVDFMSPEQARDASTVDVRADLYSLGATLYYALTGQLPFPQHASPIETLARRLTSPPPSLSDALKNCPEELDRFVTRMMAVEPSDRLQTPQEVMKGLLQFISLDSLDIPFSPAPITVRRTSSRVVMTGSAPRVLVVDDDQGTCDFARHVLDMLDLDCDVAESGEEALKAVAGTSYDLILLDMYLPGMSGAEVLKWIRTKHDSPNLKIIILSGQATPDEMAAFLHQGADDYLSKPFSTVQFHGRVRAAMR